jgi:hypothetical protein
MEPLQTLLAYNGVDKSVPEAVELVAKQDSEKKTDALYEPAAITVGWHI